MPKSTPPNTQPPQEAIAAVFTFFNEIGIVNQLASTLFQKKLRDGVTIAQFSVLNHLIRVKDGQTPLYLSKAFQVPKTSMTHSLTKLEERGFITLKSNPKDGRSKCVWLTDAGREFRDDAIQSIGKEMMRLAPLLDFEAMQKAVPALQHVREVLDEDRNDELT